VPTSQLPPHPAGMPDLVYLAVVFMTFVLPGIVALLARRPSTSAVSVPPLQPSPELVQMVHDLNAIAGTAAQLTEMRVQLGEIPNRFTAIERHLVEQDGRIANLEQLGADTFDKARAGKHQSDNILASLPGIPVATANAIADRATAVLVQVANDDPTTPERSEP
jgi:hypothetical protein